MSKDTCTKWRQCLGAHFYNFYTHTCVILIELFKLLLAYQFDHHLFPMLLMSKILELYVIRNILTINHNDLNPIPLFFSFSDLNPIHLLASGCVFSDNYIPKPSKCLADLNVCRLIWCNRVSENQSPSPC